MDETVLLKVLEACHSKETCLLTELYELAPKKEIHKAIDDLMKEDHLIELEKYDSTGIPQYRITALGKIALKEGRFLRF